MESILLNYENDQEDGLEMLKLAYKNDEEKKSEEDNEHKNKRQKTIQSSPCEKAEDITEILNRIEKIIQYNGDDYIKQCMDYVSYFPKFNKSMGLDLNLDTDFTDFKKLIAKIRNDTKLGHQIFDFLKYIERLINLTHYEYNLKLLLKGLPYDVLCPCCKKSRDNLCVVEKNTKTIWGHYIGSVCGNEFRLASPNNLIMRTRLGSKIPIFELVKM